MQFFIAFLEGIITFISPCLLPMLPVYISYFAGGGDRKTSKTLKNAFGFVLGFTILFVLMGALASVIGAFLTKYQTILNIVTGTVVIFFGLNFLGVLKFNLFKGFNNSSKQDATSFLSSVIFGIVFSVGWTPCVGAFLGSALMLSAQQGNVLTGVIMLLAYSIGLGIPFIVSAVLIDKLKSAFNVIKNNYKIINKVCGTVLIIVGILMATGTLNKLITL